MTNASRVSTDFYEKQILDLLRERGPDKTVCPSEVLQGKDKKDKELMKQVRSSAKKLVHQGIIVIMQKGLVVDLDEVKGPIRLKLK